MSYYEPSFDIERAIHDMQEDISKLAAILQSVLTFIAPNPANPSIGLIEDIDALIKIKERYK